MPFNVPAIAAQAIDVVASETISVYRRTGGTYDSATGAWIPPSVTTSATSVAASVQPMRGDAMRRIPANRRHEEWVQVFSRTQLVPGSKLSGVEADRFDWNGRTYEVEMSEPWEGRFYSAVAVRVGDQ